MISRYFVMGIKKLSGANKLEQGVFFFGFHLHLFKKESEKDIFLSYFSLYRQMLTLCLKLEKTCHSRVILILSNQSSGILQHSQNRPTEDRWLKL